VSKVPETKKTQGREHSIEKRLRKASPQINKAIEEAKNCRKRKKSVSLNGVGSPLAKKRILEP